MADKNFKKLITGACGEHYVAAYLSSQGLVVALPRAGVPGCDLLVTKASGGHPIRLQVKTGTSSKKNYEGTPIYYWPTSLGATQDHHDSFWYAYVFLNGWPMGSSQPSIFFVPSKEVAKCLENERDESLPCYWKACDLLEKESEGLNGLSALLRIFDSA